MKSRVVVLLVVCALGAWSCGDDAGAGLTDEVPETYEFASRFEPGQSSVSYSGQVARQVLINDLTSYIGGLSDAIDGGTLTANQDGDVIAALDYFYRFDSDASGAEAFDFSTDPPTLQSTWSDIAGGRDLVSKTAGNDAVTDHRDWQTELRGWSDVGIAEFGGSTDSPEGLIVAFFETLEQNAIGRANGVSRTSPGGGGPLPVHVTESGLDLQQLVQKFLLGAVAFSQGADDYLDSDVADKGLRSSNDGPDGESVYTSLEHAWDEGFGYFGAARWYLALGDEQIADVGHGDMNEDGRIDVLSEVCFGASVNAAKRDRGSSADAPTDFSGTAMRAFLAGRAIISSADGELTAAQMTALEAERDAAVRAWEGAIAATVVHYINDTLQVMGTFGTDDYDFLEHAKVWSEMKGFALGFQFNPRSAVSQADFVELHSLLRDAPVLADADDEVITQYRADLLAARDLLQASFAFDAANLGDDDGLGGW